MRLFNEDSAKDAKFPIVPEGISEVYVKGWNDAIDAIVNNAPTVERPKGEWIKTNDYVTCAYGCIDYVKCSCCKNDSLEEGDYCPNCGADMRGGQDNDPN